MGLAALIVFPIIFVSCTKKFKEFNTESTGLTNDQLIPDNNNIGGFFPGLQYAIVPNDSKNSLQGVLGEYHVNSVFAGFTTEAYPEEGPGGTYNFSGWDNYLLFGMAYNSVMAPINNLKISGASASAPDFWGIALILQVAEMHKITDAHGPIPYSKYGAGGSSVAYDSQEDIYHLFFAQLDTAVDNLKTFIATFPGATPFKKFDVIYGGDYSKWLKYANSLRLRLAMHVVKIDPALAETEALKAIDPTNGGVFSSNADNAMSRGGYNLLFSAAYEWTTLRMGASIISYMDGFNDPRIGKYSEKSVADPSKYIGLKGGSIIHAFGEGQSFSNISSAITKETPGMLMNASEVKFLLAEAALREWDMGGTAQEFYEQGIALSFEQWGAGAATDYINDAVSTCKDHVDPFEPLNNSPALSSITIKWDDAATNEQKLERIITQKWIALFPDGTEGWTNFRRTGYPKLFPVTPSQNHSNGTISTEIQIRREPYPITEHLNNGDEVSKALQLLGGPDNGGTRVWWDVDGPNF